MTAINSYYSKRNDNLAFIQINTTKLLIMDLGFRFNRRIFEMFNISYDIARSFQLKFTSNNSSIQYSLDECLLSLGFADAVPVSSLESIFMKLYSFTGQSYLQSHTIVKDRGDFALKPAELKTFQYGPGIKAESTSNTFKLSTNIKNIDATNNDDSLELLDEQNKEINRLDTGLGIKKQDSADKVSSNINE